jgi:hypothetical protein
MMADFDEATRASAEELYELLPAIGQILQTVDKTKKANSDWASWVKMIRFYEEPLALFLQHVDNKIFPSFQYLFDTLSELLKKKSDDETIIRILNGLVKFGEN